MLLAEKEAAIEGLRAEEEAARRAIASFLQKRQALADDQRTRRSLVELQASLQQQLEEVEAKLRSASEAQGAEQARQILFVLDLSVSGFCAPTIISLVTPSSSTYRQRRPDCCTHVSA